MAKPILIIRMPESTVQYFDKIRKSIRTQLNEEYHVLTVGEDINSPEFQVLNVDKEPEIKYSELKKLIQKEVEA